ncbi:restriction endonuclease subunit S [Campylobacter jejuni]|uniref:Restriction endonuclease subunit S n=3 Tax=Campylobacter TaxID=194 RepID=A0A5Y8XDI6_CAMJU|nr:restriction endonuclease subunit S [Campylobacter jejuni]ASE92080.1 type I restriction endonuclease [Campylobacter jejuni]EAH6689600.1 restriction endonuclease subunit S [Campylobacter jejuni]EAI0498356.1 restriction endonuclease subunit S [Campylobacter jejuni]EAI2889322.1 restriction endonuclease subunit S [Campylobacter jejuni]EAI8067446.1 restriction endonuclease subunit S [Campylobacter jejuni]
MTNLPQGWKMETLGEILSSDKYSIKRGPFGSTLKKSFFVEKGIRIFEQYNPINNDPHWKRYFISHEKFQELEAFKATEGDLLISCSGTLGKIVELPKDTEMGIINQALLKIRLNNIKILNSYFIYYFNSPIMQEKILESTLGSAIKNIASVKILKQIEIPLPPLKKQERIVGILDESFAKIDESIKILEQDLLNLDELMQSALQKAFNPLKDNAKENYKLPQGWEWKSLGEIGEIITGTTPSKNNPNFYGNEYPLFKPSDLNGDMIIKYASDNLSKLGFDNARNLPKDTILVVCIGASIGKVGLSGVNGSCNQQINAIIPNSAFTSKYLFFVCLSNYFQTILKKNASQTTLPIINKTEFSKLQIPLPPIKEQEQITSHLDELSSHVKNLKQNYQAQIKDLQELKNSLLDKAFKGNL